MMKLAQAEDSLVQGDKGKKHKLNLQGNDQHHNNMRFRFSCGWTMEKGLESFTGEDDQVKKSLVINNGRELHL